MGPLVLWPPAGVSQWGLNKRPEGRRNQVRFLMFLAPSLCVTMGCYLSPRSHLFSRWSSSHNVLVLDPSTCSIFLTHITAWCPVLFLVISLPPTHTSTNSPFTKPSWNYPKPHMPSVSSRDPDWWYTFWTRSSDFSLWPHSAWFSYLQRKSAVYICVNCSPQCLIDTLLYHEWGFIIVIIIVLLIPSWSCPLFILSCPLSLVIPHCAGLNSVPSKFMSI